MGPKSFVVEKKALVPTGQKVGCLKRLFLSEDREVLYLLERRLNEPQKF
jgi:hypothetical protein